MNFLVNFCDDLEPIVNLLKNVVKLLQFGIPFLLILFGMIDLGKAVMAGKEDEMKKYQGALIKRLVYAIAIFLVVPIVGFAIGLVGSEEWKECWGSTGEPTIEEVE